MDKGKFTDLRTEDISAAIKGGDDIYAYSQRQVRYRFEEISPGVYSASWFSTLPGVHDNNKGFAHGSLREMIRILLGLGTRLQIFVAN